MYTEIIGTQQILITAIFLGVMVAILLILRRKSVVIRAGLKIGKRINVVEDRAVSPTERLRIVAIDREEFLMVSARGQAPSLLPLKRVLDERVKNETVLAPKTAEENFESQSPPPLATSSASDSHSGFPSADERAVFVEKYQSWRKTDAVG